MKLYMFPVAPNPTKVRLYLAEKAEAGGPIELEQVSVNLPRGEQNSPEHLARNPRGTLPVLELDDGTYLSESLAIIEYLEELHPEPPLIGTDPRERSRVREIERIADIGVLLTVARLVHASNSPLGLPPNPEIADYARRFLPNGLRALEHRLADGRPFLAGARASIADCTLAAAFQFARVGKVEVDPDSEFPGVARWNEAYRARAPAQSVLIA